MHSLHHASSEELRHARAPVPGDLEIRKTQRQHANLNQHNNARGRN